MGCPNGPEVPVWGRPKRQECGGKGRENSRYRYRSSRQNSVSLVPGATSQPRTWVFQDTRSLPGDTRVLLHPQNGPVVPGERTVLNDPGGLG